MSGLSTMVCLSLKESVPVPGHRVGWNEHKQQLFRKYYKQLAYHFLESVKNCELVLNSGVGEEYIAPTYLFTFLNEVCVSYLADAGHRSVK